MELFTARLRSELMTLRGNAYTNSDQATTERYAVYSLGKAHGLNRAIETVTNLMNQIAQEASAITQSG